MYCHSVVTISVKLINCFYRAFVIFYLFYATASHDGCITLHIIFGPTVKLS